MPKGHQRYWTAGRIGKGLKWKQRRKVSIGLHPEIYARIEQIAMWEGRPPGTTVTMLVQLGLEVYEELMSRVAGQKGQLTLPEGMPAMPGIDMLMDAVGRGILVREAAKKVQLQSAEFYEEQRRERLSEST